MFISHIFTYFVINFSIFSCKVADGKNIYSSRSEFFAISQTVAFVDKSMMLKRIFEYVEAVMITAPRRFGKSTNLDMLKNFLSISSDKKTASKIRTEFEKLKIYKQERTFFDKHFGIYPVLHVSFKTVRAIRSEVLAMNIIKDKIYETYKMHRYLCYSDKLTDSEREYCDKWCDMGNYRNIDLDEMRVSLRRLSELLHIHFNGKKVFVLVDEYDALIASALFYVSSESLENIVGLITDMLCEIVKENSYVERTVITGISYLTGSGLSGLNNLKICRFLEDHPFVDFYGFTEAEVNELFRNPLFNITQKHKKNAEAMYNGYRCKNGQRIYNPHSILNFLQDRVFDNYWVKSGYVAKLNVAFKIPQMKEKFEALLMGKRLEINFNKHINLDDLFDLQNMFAERKIRNGHSNYNLLLYHLLELGYLTYVRTPDALNCTSVKLPNREVAESLLGDLKEYYIAAYNLDRNVFSNITCDNYNEKYSEIMKFTKKGYKLVDVIYMLGKVAQTVFHYFRILL